MLAISSQNFTSPESLIHLGRGLAISNWAVQSALRTTKIKLMGAFRVLLLAL